MNSKAIIITIGDELLIGQTIDTNSAWMAKQLNEQGIDVTKRIAVGDNRKDIIDALDSAIAEASIILITGGLGPTADDITKPLLCEYFGGKLIVNQETLENVKRIFERRNLPLLERNLKQAEVPDNCKVLQNKRGTAPGMCFEKDEKIIISMPGVPDEMMGMMENDVLSLLSEHYYKGTIVHRNILTAGLGESFIAERIAGIENSLPEHIKLAYLPGNWMVKLRLTGKDDGTDNDLAKTVEGFQIRLAEELKDIVISLQDEPVELILHRIFTGTKRTLALAESCTGGYIGHTLTQVEGASDYFLGGVVSYDVSIKEKILGIPGNEIVTHGEVSEAVAKQMAERVRMSFSANIGFVITGWLSNSPRQEDIDTGTVWMAVCDQHTTKVKKFHFPYNRIRNKEIALQMALLMIWKFANGKEI